MLAYRGITSDVRPIYACTQREPDEPQTQWYQDPSEAVSITVRELAMADAGKMEVNALLSALNGERDHVLGALEGLSDESLRRPVLPSGWTCLGLVQHLALDVERFWFCEIITRQTADTADSNPSNAWVVSRGVAAESVLGLYRHQIRRANEIIAGVSPDAAPAWWPSELWPDWRLSTVREVILHVITETAVHAGHLDAVRELIDGRQWLVLT